jgi:hypothetical protein
MTISLLIDKVEDYDLLTQKEKVKLLSYFYCIDKNVESFTASEIKKVFEANNLEIPTNINREFSSLTSTKPATLIRKGKSFSFQRNSKKSLDELFLVDKHVKDVSIALRSLIQKVSTDEQKKFLEEGIACFETKSFRAAIVMVWLLSMDILQEHVLNNSLVAFNDELRKKNKKKFITYKSDFEEYKEGDIIENMRSAGIISKEQKKLLDEKLNVRNSAAHPNTVQFREPKVVTYIQELVEEIVYKF